MTIAHPGLSADHSPATGAPAAGSPAAGSPAAAPQPAIAHQVVKVRQGTVANVTTPDTLAEEMPVALTFNGISHATMLATPSSLEDFAVGFALTEGIVDRYIDIRDITETVTPEGIVIDVEISSAAAYRLKDRRRAMAGRTGCGLCGVETLPEVTRSVRPVGKGRSWRPADLAAGMVAMRTRQTLHDETGATHAAGWLAPDGTLGPVREDVGRHNALDKLLGVLAREDVDVGAGAVLVSSRASFEMVQKTAILGGTLLAAVSAPTSMAARLAERSGVTLLGFVRQENCTIYSHAERIEGAALPG